MRVPMYKRYESKQPIGAISLCNTFGLLVFNPDDEDKCSCDLIVAYNNGERTWSYHKHKIHYSTAGRAYIRKGLMRVYLDEVMRV